MHGGLFWWVGGASAGMEMCGEQLVSIMDEAHQL